MTAIKTWYAKGQTPVSIAPLVSFRIGFGLLMFVSLIRFMWRGWVDAVYIQPRFHFSYWGFEWIRVFDRPVMYLLVGGIALCALLVALGLFYRVAIVLFFLGFTYVELIDKTTYLNHYYFISLVAFIMIWLPAAKNYSLDILRNPSLRRTSVPLWTIGLIRFQLAIVYIFAGLAKINADWLLNAEPMRTWLPSKSHLPLVGSLMYKEWVAYLFSWFGALYDLFIVFLLLHKRSRPYAYAIVLLFHTATAIFFPGIGMFPYVMMVSSLIFFSGSFHQKLLSRLSFGIPGKQEALTKSLYRFHQPVLLSAGIGIYMLLQLLIPLRFLAYPGHLFWNEEGYRFSWRVMLMEKAGVSYFTITDGTGKERYEVNNTAYLTPLQEKMMSTQPDMILSYAHYLAKEYEKKGINNPKVYAEVYVALNGNRSTLFVDSTVNLAAQKQGWQHHSWVLPWK